MGLRQDQDQGRLENSGYFLMLDYLLVMLLLVIYGGGLAWAFYEVYVRKNDTPGSKNQKSDQKSG